MYDFINPKYAVIGDGEETIVELMKALVSGTRDCSHVNGIAYRTEQREFIVSPSRPPITNLDELNLPAFPGETIAVKEVSGLPNCKLMRSPYSGAFQAYMVVEYFYPVVLLMSRRVILCICLNYLIVAIFY